MIRLLLSIRPLLIVALAVGAVFFAPKTPEIPRAEIFSSQDETNAPDSALRLSDTSSETLTAEQSQGPPLSIFGTLFGEDAVDPLFHLPDGPLSGSPSAFNPNTAPTQEPARSIYRYLVAASDIGFSADASRLGLVLATAEKGGVSGLQNFIADLEEKQRQFESLAPPDEIREIHEESVRVVLRYIQHLKNTLNQTPGSVQGTWTGPERQAIGEEAQRINQKIRDLVHTHDISLPEGVLP